MSRSRRRECAGVNYACVDPASYRRRLFTLPQRTMTTAAAALREKNWMEAMASKLTGCDLQTGRRDGSEDSYDRRHSIVMVIGETA